MIHNVGRMVEIITPEHGLHTLESALEWLMQNRDALRSRLLERGHLLLRGLPIATATDFAQVRDVLVSQPASYKEKATPRSDFGEGIYSSTDLPPAQAIALHNENSYTLDFPGVLIFGCLEAPEEGGATTVADVREVLAAIPPRTVERFRMHGWLLKRAYHTHVGLNWPTAFGVAAREDVEAYCDRNLIAYSWREGESLHTSQRRSALIRHPLTRDEVWFNHVAFWSKWSLDEEVRDVLLETYGEEAIPFDTALGDGSAISRDDIDEINAAYRSVLRREPWQVGDVLLIDNILCAHGRDSYRGKRRIVVAMGEPVELRSCDPTVIPGPGCFVA